MENNGINDIIDDLYDLIQDARGVPFSTEKCIIEKDKALDLLDEIIAALPENIKKANTILTSRNELINQAQKEAEDMLSQARTQAATTIASANSEAEKVKVNAKNEAENIIEKAKIQAQELVSKEAVYKDTEKQCKDMVDKTNAQIAELRSVSYKYISESLETTAKTIESALKDVNNTRTKFDTLTGEKKKPLSNNKHSVFTDICID